MATDPALAQQALALALDGEAGRANTVPMFYEVAKLHPDRTFAFALSEMKKLEPVVDANALSRFYPALGRGSADSAMIGKLNAFASAHMAPEARRPTEIAVASIQGRLKVIEGRLPAIVAWLAEAR